MKLLIRTACLGCLIYLQSCGDGMIKNKDADAGKASTVMHSKIPIPDATVNMIIKDEKDIVGYWVGEFYHPFKSIVNISIDKIDGDDVSGHTLISGTLHSFTGTIRKEGTSYRISVKQTGSGIYNGNFELSIANGDSTLTGTWTSGGDAKKYESLGGLSKKLFSYDAGNELSEGRYIDYQKSRTVKSHDEDAGDFDDEQYITTSVPADKYNASSQLLTKEDVANMKKADILILRNSIFARHGYAFKKPGVGRFFGFQRWYVPISTDVTAELTAVEKKNIGLLMRYEKNAKEYYESFGR